MIREEIDLYDYFHRPRGKAVSGTLAAFRHGQMNEMPVRTVRPAMLVLPGGGYGFVSQREAEPVAMEYYAQGFDVFVLDYDVAPVGYPVQLEEAAMAMMYIRRNADAFDILPDKVAAIGFSAGGHLLGCIGTIWNDPAVKEIFGGESEKVRPDASVYSYAVVSPDPAIYRGNTFKNFCGGNASPHDYAIDANVGKDCRPAVIWGNSPDRTVLPEHAVRLYLAYLAAGVPVELHLFREGWHGMTVCSAETEGELPMNPACDYVRPWIGLSVNFLKTLGFVPEKREKR